MKQWEMHGLLMNFQLVENADAEIQALNTFDPC